MGKVPRRRRGNEGYDPISETCARLIFFTATEVPRGTSWVCNKCGFLLFSEVNNEAFCRLGVNWKRRKTGPASTTNASMRPTHSNPLGVIFFAVAESVLKGSNGWQQMWRFKKLTLRVTVLGRTEKNEVAQHRRRLQEYDPQTIIFFRVFLRIWNASRKTALGWNNECVVLLFVFHERRLCLFRREKKWKSAPSSTRN